MHSLVRRISNLTQPTIAFSKSVAFLAKKISRTNLMRMSIASHESNGKSQENSLNNSEKSEGFTFGRRSLIGVCQLTSQHDLDQNFEKCVRLIEYAKIRCCKVILSYILFIII